MLAAVMRFSGSRLCRLTCPVMTSPLRTTRLPSDGLKVFGTEFVRFSFTDAPKPAVISGQDEPLLRMTATTVTC